MLITPTLVIGIGSSGLEIAESVRELMVEEFLTPGLPVVRFMNISSHTGGETSRDGYKELYQQLETAEISISPPLFDSVQFKLDPASNQYMKGLDEWFDRRLLNFDRAQLESGMANTRGLGRLALWLNWGNVTSVVNRNLQAIQNVRNLVDTNDFIYQYINNPQLPANHNFIHSEMNVVIVGSLHGGTCSGSFLDLAYYIKDQYPLAKIFGHFTFMDNNLTQLPNNSQLSTNAFSALTEMDYLAEETSSFEVQFPNTQVPKKFFSFPFTRVFLLSTTNTEGRRSALVTQAGIIKLENLHKLIALSIFFDIVGSKQKSLEGLRINWANNLYNSRPLQTPRYQKIFNSYGSLAFWYPKVRITSAAACAFIQEKYIEYWDNNKARQNRNKVGIEVKKTFNALNSIVRETISVFTDESSGAKNTITAAKDTFINDVILDLKKGSVSVSDLLARLNQEPKGKPFATRFKTNGYFYETITLQLDNAKLKVVNLIKAQMESLVRQVFKSGFDIEVSPNDYMCITDLIDFSNQLTQMISRTTGPKLPVDDIDYSGCSSLLDQIRIEQDRTLTAIVFMREEVLNQYFDRFSDEIRRIYNEAEQLLLEHFVTKILNESYPKVEEILQKSIRDLQKHINETSNLADKELNELLDMQNFTTLQIITQTESVESDVKALKATITNAQASQILLDSMNVLYDRDSSAAEIFQTLKTETQKRLLLQIDVKQFSIGSRLTDDSYLQYAPDLYPLFEKAINFSPYNYPNDQRPNLLAGGNTTIRQRINTLIGRGGIGNFNINLDVDLNHLIYIYKEESGIALSEYAAYSGMKAQYDLFARQNYGFHIDKNPTKFDVERLLNYKDMVEQKWFKVTKDLFLSEIFQEDGINLKFSFKDRNEIEYPLFFRKDDEEAFYSRLKDDVPAFAAFKAKYDAVFARLDKISFNNLIDGHRENLRFDGWDLTSSKFRDEMDFYYKILNTRWP